MILKRENLEPAEVELIEWQYRYLGGFKAALWLAISKADGHNLIHLKAGYPEQVKTYCRFTRENGYWEDVLQRAGLHTVNEE